MKKAGKSRGFTLAEMLIVVAIIGILLAVAIPSVISYYRSLKLTELDDSARTIFMAAQNRLTAMKSAGEDLYKLSSVEVNTNAPVGTATGRYFAVIEDNSLATLVPGGSIESQLHDNHYVVEIDAKTGAVYAVWYWEKEGFDYETDAYDSVKPDKSGRLENGQMVGYYGGSYIDRLTIGQTPLPSAQVINAEELRLEITVPGYPGGSDPIINAAVTLSDSSGHKVTIINEAELDHDVGPDNIYSGTLVLDTLDDSKYTLANNENSFESGDMGKPFKEWVETYPGSGKYTIAPGSNVNIEVKVTAVDPTAGKDHVDYLPQYIYLTDVNSLFAGLEDSGTTALIAYGRHLQNLHNNSSGVSETIKKAVQTRNINFTLRNKSGEDKDNIYFWANTYPDDSEDKVTLKEDGILDLHPLSNINLTSYDGRGYEIRNMSTGRNGWGGLFSMISSPNFSFSNVTLVNPHVHASGNSAAAGGLAGSVMNVKIDNCKVYNEYDAAKDDPEGVRELCDAHSVSLDSLVFKTTSSGEMYAEQLCGVPHISAPEDNNYAGGLVGVAYGDIEIKDSFASVIVIGEETAGGLVGEAGGDVNIEGSYSGSYVYFNNHGAGLVGVVVPNDNALTIKDSYAAGEIVSGFDFNNPVTAGLFTISEIIVRDFESVTVEDCYVAARLVGGTYYKAFGTFNSKADRVTSAVQSIENVFYIKQGGFNYSSEPDKESAGTAVTTAELTAKITATDTTFFADKWNTGADVKNSLTNTHAYRLLTETKDLGTVEAYPYPMLKIGGAVVPQYGDWLESKAGGVLAYWEKYALDAPDTDKASTVAGDGKYGIWGYIDPENPGVLTDTLMNAGDKRDGTHYAIGDGYGVLVKDGAAAPETVTFTHKYDPSATIECKVSATGIAITLDGETYQLYPIENLDSVPLMGKGAGATGTAVTTVYYYRVNLDGKEYLVNPHFACEIAAAEAASEKDPAGKKGAKGAGDETTTEGVVIRTARQLAYVSEYTTVAGPRDSAREWIYRQLLDVDYAKYGEATKGTDKDHRQSPIDLGKDRSSTGGTYYGNTFQIRNLYIGDRTVVDESVGNIGVFGSVHGTSQLDGIRLVNVDVDVSTNSVGGLVGFINNNAVINNCGIYCEDQTAYGKYTIKGDSYVGGLAGVIAENVKVTGSFAAVKVIGSSSYVGGFTGQIGGNAVITNCYVGGHTEDGEYKLDDDDNANVTGNTSVGGFIGLVAVTGGDKPYLEGINYTTASVKYTNSRGSCGYFIGAGGGLSAKADAVLYATGDAYNYNNAKITPTTTYEGVNVLTGHGLAEVKKGGATAYPYDETLMTDKDAKTGDYPYLTAVKDGSRVEHHGDWIIVPPEPILAYIEEYSDGTKGVYSIKRDGTSATADLNSLRLGTDGVTVTRDMYRLISEEELTGYTYTLNTGSPQALPAAEKMTLGGIEYFTYDVANSPVTGTNFYNKLTVTAPDASKTSIFFYNTAFACEAFDMTASNSFSQSSNLFDKPQAEGQGTVKSYSHVVIRSARQLPNLARYTTGADINSTIKVSYAQKWTCHQLMPIDFALYVGKTLTGDDIPGKMSGAPLTPAKLTSGKYYGYKYEIRNLFIGPDSGGGVTGTGLFGELTSGTVSGVRLVNASVAGGDSTATGGLVGLLSGGTVKDCGIYVDLKQQTAIGDLETLYGTMTVSGSGGNGVGGLIGQMTRGSVTGSFAAVKVEGTAAAAADPALPTNPVGGFVGQVTSGTIENCYAGGYVDASGTYVDTSVNVTGNNRVGGFVGNISTATSTFKGICYSTASVGGADMANVGLFAGASSYSLPTTATKPTLYAVAKAFKANAAGTYAVDGQRDEADYLSNPEKVRTAGYTEYHYNRGYETFPYKTNLDAHYGDWIGLTQGAYYDTTQASGATTQTTGWCSQGGALSADGFNTLATEVVSNGRFYAVDDGYAFLSVEDMGGEIAMNLGGAGYTLNKRAAQVTIGSTAYWAYDVPSQAMNAMTEHYYATVCVNGQFFTANFALAAEIFDGKTEETELDTVKAKSGIETVEKTVESDGSTTATKKDLDPSYEGGLIRSARQLANLGVLTNSEKSAGETAKALTYNQVIDIDFDEYKDNGKNADGSSKLPSIGTDGTYNHQPITLEGGSTRASYNGHGCDIVGLAPGFTALETENIAASGLFSRAKNADLTGIRIVNSTFNATTGVTGGTGGGTGGTTPGGGGTGGTGAVGSTVSGLKVITTDGNGKNNSVFFNVDRLANPSTWPSGGGQILYESTDPAISENDGFFGIVYTSNGSYPKIESRSYTAEGSTINHALRLHQGIDTNYIEFATSGPAEVKLWWRQEADGRQMQIKDSDGNLVAQTSRNPSTFSKTNYFDSFNISDAGVYHIGGSNGANWYFRIEVKVTSNTSGTGGTGSGGTGSGGSTGGNVGVTGYKIRVGALAGILDNAIVDKCGVYVEPEDGGTAYGDYDKAYNKFEVKNTVAGSDTDLVGGLAGNVTGSTVKDSFAAVKVTGVRVVGGFAGRLAAGTSIENCYVGGHTYQGTFFGQPEAAGKEGKGIVNVQATAAPASGVSVAVGGFAGDIPKNDTTVTFKGVNYSTASFGVKSVYMGTTAVNDDSEVSHLNADLTFSDDTTEMGQFIGKVRDGAKVQQDSGVNLYAMGEAFVNGEYVGLTATAKGNGYEKHENDDGYDFKTSGDKDVPYINHKSGDYLNPTALVANVTKTSSQKYDTALSENYPYAQAQSIHHGDWTNRYNLIYYEVYSKDDPNITDKSNLKVISDVCGENYIGFYAVLRNEDNSEGATINTLSLTGHVIDSGYMVLSSAKVDTMKFSINSTYGGKLATENSVLLQRAGNDPVEFKGTAKDASGATVPVTEEYYIYPVPFATINIAPSDTYYQHVTINGQPYMLNQHFACEAINVGLVGTDGEMDYTTVRAKPGLQYYEYVRNNQNEIKETKLITLDETQQVIIIRSPWNLAGMARYTRDGNESTHRNDARKWTYLQTMDIDYTKYKEGQIYDGNTTNRSEPVRSKWFAGTNFPYGQAPAQLVDGGHYNGNGHIIANLYLSSDSTKKAYVGLFGLVSGKDTVVENMYMENLHVNAWGGPDDGIYVGGIAGEIAKGATLRNVSVHNLEMDFHKVPTWDKDNSTYKEGGTTKFKAVGGVAGHLTGGSVSNVYVNGLSIDFESKKYSYSWTHEKATDSNGKEKDDYYINEQLANSSSGTKYGSSVHEKQESMSVGGAIGEIDASASGVKVSVSDVYVVDPTIKANKGKGNFVGGVVGKADGKADSAPFDESKRDVIVISNCGVYLTDPVGTGNTDKYYTTGIVSGNDKYAGGFVGRSDEYVKIVNSFAAIRVWGQKEVGGFAGHIDGSWVENCFAGGHTESGGYKSDANKANVKADGPEASVKYKQGETTKDYPRESFAGGFAGVIERSATGSTGALRLVGTVYSTASVYSPTIDESETSEGSSPNIEYTRTTTGGETGVFVGDPTRGSSMKSMLKDVEDDGETVTLYATGIAVGGGIAAWDEAAEYGLLTGLNVPTGSANAENRYDRTLPEGYPFKNETKVNIDGNPATAPVAAHFGDWAETKMVSAFYYEFEEGGSYHYYSLRGETTAGKFGDKALDSLCKERDGKAITAWGYGYIAPEGVTVTDKNGTEIGAEPTNSALKTALESEFGAGVKIVSGSTTAKAEPDIWTFNDGTNSISFYVNTAYGAAIEAAEKASGGTFVPATLGTEKNAYQIRAVGQMDNMDGTNASNLNTNYFKETHDIGGKGATYSGVDYFGGHFDGQSYRILDINITNGGLFNQVYGDVVLENIVLYAPENDGKITVSGNAGGLVAATGGTSLTVRNCAVAGYTINATGGNAGGLVGIHENGTLTIRNSEATTTLSGSNVGGLVGTVGASAGEVTVTDSYAGGEITSASSAGGIIGSQDTSNDAEITYKNVYAYVKMDKVAEANQKYGIGPKVDREGRDHLGFWGGGMTNVEKSAYDRKLRKSLLSLVDWSDDPEKETASEQTYIPGTDGLADKQPVRAFPYKAFVTDWQGNNVHYGDWPEPTEYAGLFYWEKEIVFDKDHPEPDNYRTEYHFYAYGAEVIDGNVLESEIVDTLCYSHHTKERASIVDYGYGYFFRDDSNAEFATNHTTPKNEKGTDYGFEFNDADMAIKDSLLDALELTGTYTVKVADDMSKAYSYKGRAIWSIKVGGKEFFMNVYPTFGAAIYDDSYDMGEGNDNNIEDMTPFVARTAGQLNNMTNNTDSELDYYTLSHDIDFKYTKEDGTGALVDSSGIYMPGTIQAHVLDGKGYRLVDFSYTPASGDASLFTSFKQNISIKNLIMYSPDSSAKIVSTDGNAGAIIAKADRTLTLENCVVSGYTIQGAKSVGGFVGETSSNNGNKFTNCQAVVNLVGTSTGTSLGGIVGKVRGTIVDCYTGGTVKFDGATPGTQAKVGGIYGAINNSVTVNNCYTYMDLKTTGASATNVYPIGDNGRGSTIDSTCSYYKDNFPDGNTNANQATALEISGLAVKEGENAAEYSWWPDTAAAGYYGWDSNQKGGFPFRAVASFTEDGVKHYVHYGQWPYEAQVMGIAYWEKYSDGTVGLQIAGVDKDGNQLTDGDGKIIDTLRKTEPTDEIAESNEIEATGYAAFSTIYNMSVSLNESAGAAVTDDTAMKIAHALDEQLKGVCTHMSVVTTPEGTGNGTVESATVTVNGTPTTLYYSSGFAGVSYDATFGQKATPFEIRTVAQLDNIPEGSAACFKQTHDLYGDDYSGYTGAVNYAGDYDGQGYRILDLDIEGTISSDSSGIGLFNSVKPKNRTTQTIENVVLYSPKGDGKIEVDINDPTSNGTTEAKMGVGGIVGYIDGDTTNGTVAKIKNCAVAGYNISVKKSGSNNTFKASAGGIAGYSYYSFSIQNCEAVTNINVECNGEGVGGILGAFHSSSVDTTEIKGSYAGGSITTSDDKTHSGGIFGYDANKSTALNVDKCYTYVDLSGVKIPASDPDNCYAIGYNGHMVSGKTNYYLNDTDLYPAGTNKNGTAATYEQMKGIFKDAAGAYTDGFGAATKSYVPDGKPAGGTNSGDGWKPQSANFPFPAVQINGKYVHYGEWPNS